MVRVEIITYLPTHFLQCRHCELTWQVAGLGKKVHREEVDSGLPDDLAAEFHRLAESIRGWRERYGSSVALRLVDAASLEGFFLSVRRRVSRYPAFIVDGKKYVGSDLSQVEALIAESMAGETQP
jgi:hypothetical protein